MNRAGIWGLLIAVMTEPVTPAAHFGLFFMYPGGYYVSCGEGTIGAATVAIETGLVPRTGARSTVLIDTETGAVETIVRSDRDRVREVTLRWTPSFVALPEQAVEVDGVGEVPVDVAVGAGNVFAIVEAKHLGVSVRRGARQAASPSGGWKSVTRSTPSSTSRCRASARRAWKTCSSTSCRMP